MSDIKANKSDLVTALADLGAEFQAGYWGAVVRKSAYPDLQETHLRAGSLAESRETNYGNLN